MSEGIRTEKTEWGFKRVTSGNWTEPDISRLFNLDEQAWLDALQCHQLLPQVPADIREMFEVTRGAIAYGWFFYPLLTLASDQLFRIQEAAIRARVRASGLPLVYEFQGEMREKSFDTLLRDLEAAGLIPAHAQATWQAVRKNRNLTSHPKSSAILPPGHAVAALHLAAQQINQLFGHNSDYHSWLGENVRAITQIGRPKSQQHVVAGVDAGGSGKGFHCVLLKGAELVDVFSSPDPNLVAERCAAKGASIVAVDAPCGWAKLGSKRREAESILAKFGYQAFSTPTRDIAYEKPFFEWIFNGERLYAALSERYPLLADSHSEPPHCFETYPYLASCVFTGRRLSAKDKKFDRSAIVRAAGVALPAESAIDTIDAAICALVAISVLNDNAGMIGNEEEGYLIYPGFLF